MSTSKQREAWELFKKKILEESSQPKSNQSKVAKRLGVHRTAVSKWLSGQLKGERISVDDMREYFTRLGLDPVPYFGGESTQDEEYSKVPWLEATASMGGGSVETSKSVTAHLAFRTDWLRTKGRLRGMVVVNASGDSMDPTIPDRAVVLINEQDTHPVNNGIFFVCYGEDIYLKRLRVDAAGRVTHLVSDGTGWAMPLEPEVYFEILGRAIWYGKEL